MNTSFQYDVFLSHRAKGKTTVRALAERLRKDGLTVWPVPPKRQSLACIFQTAIGISTARRVWARGLQRRKGAPVGRVPSRGAPGYEIPGLNGFDEWVLKPGDGIPAKI